jgi:hypothetical protein
MTKRLITFTAICATLLVAMAGALVSTSAQNSATPAMGSAGHPAHIHTGTCESIGGVVFPLNDVMSGDSAGTPMATPSLEMASTPAVGASLQSTTTVDVALDDILAGEHAINVHQSAENIEVYVACGDVTGEATDGTLTVELQELNESGMSGEAMLTDNGDGTTTVEIHLMQDESGMATPVA